MKVCARAARDSDNKKSSLNTVKILACNYSVGLKTYKYKDTPFGTISYGFPDKEVTKDTLQPVKNIVVNEIPQSKLPVIPVDIGNTDRYKSNEDLLKGYVTTSNSKTSQARIGKKNNIYLIYDPDKQKFVRIDGAIYLPSNKDNMEYEQASNTDKESTDKHKRTIEDFSFNGNNDAYIADVNKNKLYGIDTNIMNNFNKNMGKEDGAISINIHPSSNTGIIPKPNIIMSETDINQSSAQDYVNTHRNNNYNANIGNNIGYEHNDLENNNSHNKIGNHNIQLENNDKQSTIINENNKNMKKNKHNKSSDNNDEAMNIKVNIDLDHVIKSIKDQEKRKKLENFRNNPHEMYISDPIDPTKTDQPLYVVTNGMEFNKRNFQVQWSSVTVVELFIPLLCAINTVRKELTNKGAIDDTTWAKIWTGINEREPHMVLAIIGRLYTNLLIGNANLVNEILISLHQLGIILGKETHHAWAAVQDGVNVYYKMITLLLHRSLERLHTQISNFGNQMLGQPNIIVNSVGSSLARNK